MQEIWKDVEGYEGFYQVSNLGRVRSLDRQIYNKGNKGSNKFSKYKGRVLSQGKKKKGYLSVSLTKNCKSKSFPVHRLVAKAFIPNPNNLLQINHKDEDKANNKVENLEWCDNKYNVNYGSWREKQSKAHTNSKWTSKMVRQFDKNGNFIKVYPSIAEAKRQTQICHISSVATGKRKTAGGYIWRFC